MKRLFTQLSLAILLLCSGYTQARAEDIAYLMSAGPDSKTEEIVISYSSTGYTTKIKGKPFSALEKVGDIVTVRFEKITVTMVTQGDYWHMDQDTQKVHPIISSDGDLGFHKVLYEGLLNGNRLYKEEVWINGFLSHMVKSLLDEKGRFIWSVTVHEHGKVYVVRK